MINSMYDIADIYMYIYGRRQYLDQVFENYNDTRHHIKCLKHY
jgi:hypothetical protein